MASRLTLNDPRFRRWSGRLRRGKKVPQERDYAFKEVEYRLEVVAVRIDRYHYEDGTSFEYSQEIERHTLDRQSHEPASKMWRALMSVLSLGWMKNDR